MFSRVRHPRRWAVLGAVLLVVVASHAAEAQEVDFTQVTRPVVQVTDSAMIDYILFELFVEPLAPPTRLQVIDVTQNGFGPDDVVIAFPSVEVFTIPAFLPDSVQALMSSWQPDVEYRMDSGNMSASALGSLIGSEADEARRAEGALLYDLVQAVEELSRSPRRAPVSEGLDRFHVPTLGLQSSVDDVYAASRIRPGHGRGRRAGDASRSRVRAG